MKLLAGNLILSILLSASVIATESSFSANELMLAAASSDDKKDALALAVSKAEHTFTVSSGEKTVGHPFYNRGSKMGFAVDGTFGKELVLTRGVSYIFDVNTSVRHDFYFTTKARGKGAGTVTKGVIGQFTYNSKVAFTPDRTIPDRMFYACRNHEYMGGLIHIINKGETVVLESATPKPVIPAAPVVVSENEVKQKIAFAKLMVMGQTAKRVEDSGNAEAMDLLDKARSGISASEAALKSDNNEEALTIVESALDNAKAAIEKLPKEKVVVDHRARYAELLQDFRNYKDSYTQKYKQAKQKDDTSLDEQLDPKVIQEMDDAAVELSTKGNYKEANEILVRAQVMVTSALVGAFKGETVNYDKAFATAQEEYQYELARYKSYEELIPLALEQNKPSEGAIQLINAFVEKSGKIVGEANEVADKGDYATAVLGLHEATRQIQRALMIAGVR